MTELVLGLRPLPLVVSKHLRVLREAGRSRLAGPGRGDSC